MFIIKLLLIQTAAWILAGCGPGSPNEDDLRKIMNQSINDPKSLEIRNTKKFTYHYEIKEKKMSSEVYCGQLHFKNSMGGYGPWIDFWLEQAKGKKFLTLGKFIGMTDPEGDGLILIDRNETGILKAIQAGVPVDDSQLKSSIECKENNATMQK